MQPRILFISHLFFPRVIFLTSFSLVLSRVLRVTKELQLAGCGAAVWLLPHEGGWPLLGSCLSAPLAIPRTAVSYVH